MIRGSHRHNPVCTQRAAKSATRFSSINSINLFNPINLLHQFRLALPSTVLFAAMAAAAADQKRSAPSSWDRSIVTLEVAAKHYDHYQPWSKPTRQFQKNGIALGDHQIL